MQVGHTYLKDMKQLITATLVLGLAVTPALAQDETAPDIDEGFSLMEEGARILLRGLMTEMEPAIDDLREGFSEMGPAFTEFAEMAGPAFAELLNRVDDFRNYEAPEFLPNGDIIIRRAPDAPVWVPEDPEAEIEL